MKWEYKSITYKDKDSASFGRTATAADVEAQMNQLGKDGWELAAALHATSEGSANLLIFKRPKADEGRQSRPVNALAGSAG